jgi:hypothetical protein
VRGATQERSYIFLVSLLFAIVLFVPVVEAVIVINEVLPNGLLEPQSEWVELYNTENVAVSLNDWNITEQGANANITLNMTIPANGFVVLVRDFQTFNTTFPNKNSTGLVVEYGALVPLFQLSNTAGNITLYNASGEKEDNVSYSSTAENVTFGRYPDGSQNIVSLATLTPLAANDNQAPSVQKWVTPSSNNSNVARLVNVTINATDDASAVQAALLTIDNANVSMLQNGDVWYFLWNTSAVQNGVRNLTVWINDTFNQRSSSTLYNVTVDNQNPSVSISSPLQAANVSGNLNITATVSDALTSISSVQVRNSSGNWIAMSLVQGTTTNGQWSIILNTRTLGDGNHTFPLNATDVVGNQNASESVTVAVDNTAPVFGSASASPAVITNSNNVTISASFADANGLKSVIFEHNASGAKQNFTGTRVSGDNFSASISNSSLSSREVVSWKAYGVDYFGNGGESPSQAFTVSNRAPVSTVIPTQTWQQNTNHTLNLLSFFSDPDGDSMNFSVVGQLQNISVFFVGNTARFVPDKDFSGTRTVAINATDGELFNVSNTFILNVTFVNTYAPQVSTIPNITFLEDGSNASLNLSDFVFDQDTPDEQITWSATGNINVVVSINPVTKILNISAVANFNGTETMRLIASDGTFQNTSNNMTVTVAPVNDAPSVPVLVSPANGANILNNSVTLVWNAASDIDGPAVSYMVFVGTSATPPFNATTASTSLALNNLQVGQTYFWRVAATDGTATSANSTRFNFTVNAGNASLPPVFTSTPPTSGQAGQSYTYDADASDPNNDPLSFSLTTAPSGMSINAATGIVSWVPTSAQLGGNGVTVQVTDGVFNVTQSFTVMVAAAPAPSIIVGGKLAITDIDVKVDSGKSSVKNGSVISKEAAPGSTVKFEVEVENLYNDTDDLDIENIEVDISIKDIDDGDDLEDEAPDFDLKPERHDTAEIEFEIPLEVDEDTYDVVITVEGEDENGTTHEVRAVVFLEVEKEKHELRLMSASASPATVKCEENARVYVDVINTGQEDEDEARITITNPELGWSFEQEFEIEEGDKDNRYEQSFLLPVPKGIQEGFYTAEVNVYYDTTRLEDSRMVTVEKGECITVEKAVQLEQARAAALQKQIEEAQKQAIQQQQAQQEPQQKSFRDSEAYEFILVSAFITASVLVVIGVVAIVLL